MSFFNKIDIVAAPFEAFFSAVQTPVIALRPDGQVVYANDRAHKTFADLDLVSHSFGNGDRKCPVRMRLDQIARSSMTMPFRLDHPSGPVSFKAWRVEVPEGEKPRTLVLLFGDGGLAMRGKFLNLKSEYEDMQKGRVREQKRARQLQKEALHLRRLAAMDQLTGLATAAEFKRGVREALQISGARGAMIYIDLDGFKSINDIQGHSAGDEVLHRIGQRLVRKVRRGDIAARVGGDEFAYWCDSADTAAALDIAERLRNEIEAVVEWRDSQGRILDLFVGASIGIASAPEDGECFQALSDVADQRMYDDKRLRKRIDKSDRDIAFEEL